MSTSEPDTRGPRRAAQDERIAAESPLPPPELPDAAVPSPIEVQLARLRRRPVAVAGIVENGLVRPLDSTVKLPEKAHVIIVATETK